MNRHMWHRVIEYRQALFDRQKSLCIWCGFVMGWDRDDAFEIASREFPTDRIVHASLATRRCREAGRRLLRSFDHFVPASAGGRYEINNGFCACICCNGMRGTADPIDYAGWITAMVAAQAHPRQIFRATGRWPKEPRMMP